MNLIISLSYHQENSQQCEALLDFIYKLGGSKPKGHLLLCHDVGVHAENRERIKISAELAFEHVYPLEIRRLADGNAVKSAKINNAFYQVAQHVSDTYLWPFLWLEPDCTPTKADWMEKLWSEYANQPRPFLGNRMQYQLKDKEPQQFMARVGIYPQNAITILPRIEAANPFELVSGKIVAPKLTPTKLIHQLAIKSVEDVAKVRPEAVIVHGDKNQILLNKVEIKKGEATIDETTSILDAAIEEMGKPITKLPPRRGRPPKVKLDCVATNGCKSSTPTKTV